MADCQPKNSMNRRTFLKSSVVLTAGAASHVRAPAIIHAQGVESPVVYALIGVGAQGRNHLRNLSTLKSGRCAGLCDTYPVNLKKGL